MVKVKLVGELYISELLLFGIAILFLLNRHFFVEKHIQTLLLFLALWFIGQVVSDVVNNASIADRLRGEIRIVFFAMDILGIYFLTRSDINRLWSFLIGLACGHLLSFLLFPSEFALDYPWKFGLAIPFGLASLFIVLKMFKNHRLISIGLLITFGIISILLAGRSLGAIFILSGSITWYLSSGFHNIQRGKTNALLLVLLLSATTGFIYKGYSFVAEQGYLGEVSQWKYNYQSSSDYGFLVSGRIEVLAALKAISDAPILGHGSWARDWKYVDFLQKIRETKFEQGNGYVPEDNLITSHSHILGAWVEAGILGAVFWVYVVFLIFQAFQKISMERSQFLPVIIWVLVMLLWDLMFSPLGAHQRIMTGFYIVIVLYVRNNRLQR